LREERVTTVPIIVILLLAIICSLALAACNNTPQIQNSLYDFLNPKITKTLQQLKNDLPKYQAEIAKLSIYESDLKSLLKPKSTTFSDTFSEMEVLTGYWISNGSKMKNVNWSFYSRDPAGNITVEKANYPTEERLMDINQRLKGIANTQIKIGWAKICTTENQQLSAIIESLQTLSTKLKVSSKEWTVKPVGENLYFISGNELGLYMNMIASGEWYFYLDNKELRPIDQQAKNLNFIIDNTESYETKLSKSNIKPEPIKLPTGGQWSYYSITQYFRSIGIDFSVGSSSINRWVDFKYSKNSSIVQELFKKYPSLKDYWDIFDSMGFKVSCAVLDLDDIRMNLKSVIPNIDETIILWVSTY
jgi:hypothetical protein